MAKPRKMLSDWDAPYIQPLLKSIETQSKEIIVAWAVDYAQKSLLPLWNKYGQSEDPRPQNALFAAKQWLSGSIKLPQAKAAILKCHEAARESEGNPVAQGAARAVAQAASAIHSTRHGMGLAFYGALAVAYDQLGTDAPWSALENAAAEECRHMEAALCAMIAKKVQNPHIVMATRIDKASYDSISRLQKICTQYETIALKLELDYKLMDGGIQRELGENNQLNGENDQINEFMCFDGDELIGYIGICSFGGRGAPLEITGMVHPNYRRTGVFSSLHERVQTEISRRKAATVLLLCDRKSDAGRKFLQHIGATYSSSEIEMVLNDEIHQSIDIPSMGIEFSKAKNLDAGEVARQNAIYFENTSESAGEDAPLMETLLPEEEEKRGMTIYLAKKDGKIIGKAHLSLSNGIGGIYGLGVLPEHRGKGFGRSILGKAVRMLLEADADEIILQVATDNATALNLYISCGFRETSTMDYFKIS